MFVTVVAGFDDVMGNLENLVYANIFDIRPLIPQLSEEYFSKYLNFTSVDLNSDVLNFKDCLINNPQSLLNIGSLETIGAIILPGIFGDYSLAIERPY